MEYGLGGLLRHLILELGRKLLCEGLGGKYKFHSQNKNKKSVAIGDVFSVIMATLKVVHVKVI